MMMIGKWVALAVSTVMLAGCFGAAAPESTVYGTSAENASKILMSAEVPPNVLGSTALQSDYQVSTDHGEGPSVIWHFTKQNYNVVSVEAKITPESGDSARVATEVRFIDGPGFAQLPGAPALVEAAKNMPHLKEVVRQNFNEFVDATMMGRKYRGSHSGATYALFHMSEISAETSAFGAALRKAQLDSRAGFMGSGSETASEDGAIYRNNTRPKEFGKPAMELRPSMDLGTDHDRSSSR